jgi:hypothetical protein
MIGAFVALTLGCHGPAAPPVSPAPGDDGLGEVIRALVTGSLAGGGGRAGQLYVAADATSDTLLRSAGLAITSRADARDLACPASTDAGGGTAAGPVGYVVQVARTGQPSGVMHVRLVVSCSFIYRGRARNFAEMGTWELRRDGGRWHIVRALSRGIT